MILPYPLNLSRSALMTNPREAIPNACPGNGHQRLAISPCLFRIEVISKCCHLGASIIGVLSLEVLASLRKGNVTKKQSHNTYQPQPQAASVFNLIIPEA